LLHRKQTLSRTERCAPAALTAFASGSEDAARLVARGFTVFPIDHRALTGAFTLLPIEDVQHGPGAIAGLEAAVGRPLR